MRPPHSWESYEQYRANVLAEQESPQSGPVLPSDYRARGQKPPSKVTRSPNAVYIDDVTEIADEQARAKSAGKPRRSVVTPDLKATAQADARIDADYRAKSKGGLGEKGASEKYVLSAQEGLRSPRKPPTPTQTPRTTRTPKDPAMAKTRTPKTTSTSEDMTGGVAPAGGYADSDEDLKWRSGTPIARQSQIPAPTPTPPPAHRPAYSGETDKSRWPTRPVPGGQMPLFPAGATARKSKANQPVPERWTPESGPRDFNPTMPGQGQLEPELARLSPRQFSRVSTPGYENVSSAPGRDWLSPSQVQAAHQTVPLAEPAEPAQPAPASRSSRSSRAAIAPASAPSTPGTASTGGRGPRVPGQRAAGDVSQDGSGNVQNFGGNQNVGSGTQNVVTHNHYYGGRSGSSRPASQRPQSGGRSVQDVLSTAPIPCGKAGLLTGAAYAGLNTEINGRSANDALFDTTGRHAEVYDRQGNRISDDRTDAKKYGQAAGYEGMQRAGQYYGSAIQDEGLGIRTPVAQNPSGGAGVRAVAARVPRMPATYRPNGRNWETVIP